MGDAQGTDSLLVWLHPYQAVSPAVDRAAFEHCVVCALTLAWKMHQVGAAAARAALPACRAEIPLTVLLCVVDGGNAG